MSTKKNHRLWRRRQKPPNKSWLFKLIVGAGQLASILARLWEIFRE